MEGINFEQKIALQKQFAKSRLQFLAGYRQIPIVDNLKIPFQKTKFPNTENDYWHRIDAPEGKVRIRYYLAPFGKFATHVHLKSDEKIWFVLPNSKAEWVTERGISYQKTGDTFYALEGEEHALVSLVDFEIIFDVEWNETMISWDAIFKKVENNTNFQYK